MIHGRIVGKAVLLAGAWLFAGAGSAANAQGSAPVAKWHTLFDGKMLDTFRGWRSEGMPEVWHVVDGTLTKEGDVDDLVTKEQFGNFELELEWKIGNAGNSGVFYRATREYDHIYWSGPEYQLLDDANAPDGRSRLTAAAAAYALYGPPPGVVKPAGEWNIMRIVAKGRQITIELNGTKIVDANLDDYKDRVKADVEKKLAAHPGLLRTTGHLGLQSHDGRVEFRNLFVKPL